MTSIYRESSREYSARTVLFGAAILAAIGGVGAFSLWGAKAPLATSAGEGSGEPLPSVVPGSEGDDESEGGESSPLLAGPSLKGWSTVPPGRRADPAAAAANTALTALAYYYRTDIYESPGRRIIGYARRGRRLPVVGQAKGRGCKGGEWYKIAGGEGYVCTKKGFSVSENPGEMRLHYVLPQADRPIPYRYAEVTSTQALRFYRLPSAKEESAIAAVATKGGDWPEVVERQMDGVFFLAIHEPHKRQGKTFFSTVYGRYVRDDDIKPLPPSRMHGEVLGKRFNLPMAFVFASEHPVYRLGKDGSLVKVGKAAKHARFNIRKEIKHGGAAYVAGPKGLLLARDAVRIARRIDKPSSVEKGGRWIHVDLSQQSLVAYQGAKPVFATIISSGKEGYEPPTGLYRIGQKHVTATMNGADPIEGWYEVEEVPWTMYYHGGYALHGAYWHDDFGAPRSHGCTNLAPADARWVFLWTTPRVPEGWHGVMKSGTWVRFTT